MDTRKTSSSLRGPLIGTVAFVLLAPGTVVGVVPFLLTRWRLAPPLAGCAATRWLGAAVVLAGAPLFYNFVARFVLEGRGTPAPIAPTQRLVVGGAFRWSRNPGYISVIAMLLGQGLFFGSAAVVLYALGVAVAFHLFVVWYEEPTLRRMFGDDYRAYCERVPRWLPRWPRRAP